MVRDVGAAIHRTVSVAAMSVRHRAAPTYNSGEPRPT